jgi:hypothetical protein
MTLVIDRPIPMKGEGIQCSEDLVRCTGLCPVSVQIIDAKQPLAT